MSFMIAKTFAELGVQPFAIMKMPLGLEAGVATMTTGAIGWVPEIVLASEVRGQRGITLAAAMQSAGDHASGSNAVSGGSRGQRGSRWRQEIRYWRQAIR